MGATIIVPQMDVTRIDLTNCAHVLCAVMVAVLLRCSAVNRPWRRKPLCNGAACTSTELAIAFILNVVVQAVKAERAIPLV